MSREDELLATIARQDHRIADLERAIGGFRWVGNNLHNAGTDRFEDFYDAALDDAQKAMGDDWTRMKLARRR